MSGIQIDNVSGIMTMNAGVVMNNGLSDNNGYGGGVRNKGTFIMGKNVLIYNNHASDLGDDVYGYDGSKTTIIDQSSENILILDDCHHLINGWYEDGINDDSKRWQADADDEDDNYYVEKEAGTYSDELALKAAHDKKFEVSYDLKGGVSNENTDTASYISGETVTIIENPVKEGYEFKGWDIDVKDTEVIIAIDENRQFIMPKTNVKLIAKWEKKTEIKVDETPTTPEKENNEKEKSVETGDKTAKEVSIIMLGISIIGYTYISKKKERNH